MSSEANQANIDNLLKERRSFDPPEAFQKQAYCSSYEEYTKVWQQSVDDPETFWREQAQRWLSWHKPFSTVLSWNPPEAQWFADGEINAAYNCLDRHVENGKGDKTAIIWEGEPGDQQTYTYKELLAKVCQCANALSQLGMARGDRVTLYMPMVPEAAIAMLACARLGLTHNVVFAGFSADALAERNCDAEARLVITADGTWRRGEKQMLKQTVDEALKSSPTVEKVLVLQRLGDKTTMQSDRDVWWHELVDKQPTECEPANLPSEHPLFILYTSGSTGKPKGIMHTTGGYMLGTTLSSHYIFDMKDEDVFWCTADVGWITGHSYVVYGPLANAATIFIYEGAPTYPDAGRFWQMIERHKISTFYTAPTAIRAFMKAGDGWITRSDLSSLRLLGTVGEPINPKAWEWFRDVIGQGRCPVVDTWWQTETGSIMIAPLPGATPTTPGTATKPFFGIEADIVDHEGNSLPANQGGYLVIKKPWPSMARTIWKNPERFYNAYWSHFPGIYFTGDGARRDEAGNFWIMGRIDDVLNVSGHRLSTMEIESALVSHEAIAEAAVVGKPDEVKGQVVACFVTLKGQIDASPELEQNLKEHVAHRIGAIARPAEIRFTDKLPKTRSGKIMRRLLRDIVNGTETSGDMTTLEDRNALESLRESS
jgi:acetyl-CoA synthetase